MQNTNTTTVAIPVAGLMGIVFEIITGDYSRGRYGDFEVIIHTKSGYVNASHLCSLAAAATGTRTDINHWTANISTKELIKAASARTGIPVHDLVKKHSVANNVRGTYMHPILIPHLASWASPEFAIKVSSIVNEYMEQQYKRTIAEKDSTINRLEAMMTELMKNSNATNTKLDAATTKLDVTTTKLDELHHNNIALTTIAREANTKADKLHQDNIILTEIASEASAKIDDLTDTVDTLQTTIGVIVEDRVPPPIHIADTEVVYIFARPRQPNEPVLQMKMTRVKRQGLTKAIARLRNEGYTIEAAHVTPTPNAVAIGTAFLNRLRSEIVKPTHYVTTVNYQSFTLRATGDDTWGIAQIAELLATIDAEKRNI
jgi:uncharacterized coiled-coil protein SlyX